jgi:DNA polymerase-1
MTKHTILLLDGDQYLHRACAAVERDVRWDEENHVLSSNEVEAYEVVEGSIKKTLDYLGHTKHVLCFSDTDKLNFRKDLVDATYKSQRVGQRKPLCFADLKRKMQAELKCVSFPGLEADDVMGILATKPSDLCAYDRIIVSRDKDMRTIPTKVWDGTRLHDISLEDADYMHFYQTLIGDASDGYKGCPGIGPKKAEKILDVAPADRWLAVVAAFDAAGLPKAYALRQARLARILRWSDWDSEKKEVKLWQP